ncbi:nitrogen fixation protein [Okeania sp. SIO1F9]|uniref:nitrogen fixation protein n=1 Tax=Okeania sp. SIO1F9 TaxID=2607813 RepID=UPI00144EEEF9|nr:nitrogen fixation protein [Okeania sp. SIO1F9]NET76711.1 nitrogen fixation protein [Okeania sp. SIO1F9]
MENVTSNHATLCPSARPEMQDSKVFGIISGTVDEPRLAYLKQPLPVTEEVMASSGSVRPTEVFRTAAPCAEKKCQHFDGANCRLAMEIVDKLPGVVEQLPPCSIRTNCRWWKQEGKAACMRCPQVITDNYSPSEVVKQVGKSLVVSK